MSARAARGRWLPDALPPLKGVWWRLFLVAWIAPVVFTLLGMVLYLRDDVQLSPRADYRLGFVAKQPFFTGVAGDGAAVWLVLSREARASGLRPGDRVVAMNGRRPGGGERPLPALWRQLGEPAAVTIETVSPDGRRASHRLTSRSEHADERLSDSGFTYRSWRLVRAAMLLIDDTLAPLVLAAILLVRRARDPLAPWVSLAFVLSAISTGMPERASALYEGLPSSFWHTANIAANWLFCAVLTLFPDGRFRPRWCWPILLVELPFAVAQDTLSLSLNQQNVILASSYLPAIAVVWAKYRLMPPGQTRQQIRWVLFGLGLSVIAFFAGCFAQAVLAATTSPALYIRADMIGNAFFDLYLFLMFAAMTVGLMRYRLYDADATISRSVAYGAMTLSLLAVFAGTEKAIELTGERYFGASLGAFASALGAAVAAALIGPVHGRITRWAERRFRSALVHLRQGLPLLVADMRETASPEAIAGAMLVRVERGVRARHGAVVVDGALLDARDIAPEAAAAWLGRHPAPTDAAPGLRWDRADPLFPMRVPLAADGVGLVGWLLLGPRPDGSLYGREERETLREIADPVARALAIAIERERRLMAQRAQDSARERQVDDLRSTVAALRRFVRDRFGVELGGGAAAPGAI